MSVITSSLRNLSSFLQDHQVSFSNGLLILFTIGGEQIFKFNAFNCPCTQPEARDYALIFMFIPAIVLGIIGVAVSKLTWRVFHGCRKREKESKNGFWKSFEYFWIIVSRAAIVPSAWLFITLLDGNYYACMKSKAPCNKTNEDYRRLVAESQSISWISLGALILIAFIVICIVRCCCDSVTYIQYRYINCYREAEQSQLDAKIEERAKKMAETTVGEFMKPEEPKKKKKDWDDVSRAPDTIIALNETKDSRPQNKESEVFLTPLHEWANRHTSRTTGSGTTTVQQEATAFTSPV